MPDGLVEWHWLALGAVLAIVEIIAPGVFFLWLGVAAIATGLVLLVLPGLPWTVQILLFAALSVVAVYAGRRFFSGQGSASDHPGLNRRGDRYVGQIFTLEEATVDGRGRLRVGDGWWRMTTTGGDLPAGVRVRVVAVEGTTLKVQAAD
jgi:inner membrane protein